MSYQSKDLIEQSGRDDESLGLRENDVVLIVADHGDGVQGARDLHDLHLLRDVLAIFLLHAHWRPAVVFDGFTSRTIRVAKLVVHDLNRVWEMSLVGAMCACSGVRRNSNPDLVGCHQNPFIVLTRFGHHKDVLRVA